MYKASLLYYCMLLCLSYYIYLHILSWISWPITSMIYINPEIQIPNLDESRIFKFIKHDQTFRWIRGQKSGHVRASQKGDHCCAESLELVLHAVGSLKDVALQTEKCQGGHGNGEAKLPETLSRSFKNPDLIILISCTELFVSRIFWCIVIYWYALTIDIYSLAVVCDSVCVFQFSLVCLMSFSLHLSVLGVGPQAAIRGPKHAWCSAWWEKPYRISFLCRIFGWHVWQIFR